MTADHAAHWCAARRWPRASRRWTNKPVLHGDNGATLKATTVLAMLYWLGVKPSYSRPRVSDDNAFAEALVPHRQIPPGVPCQGLRRAGRRARTGPPTSCTGTTWTTGTAASATSARPQRHDGRDHAILAAGTPCISRRENAIQPAGHGIRATGRPSASSRSIPSVTRVVSDTSDATDTQPLAA